MPKNTKNVAIELTTDEQKAEQAAFALAKAGHASLIDGMLSACGMAISADEHNAARPLSDEEKAEQALKVLGLDLASLKATAKPAKAGKLALNIDALAKAVEKYGKHAIVFDQDNGTSICTHFMLNRLAETGRVSLSDTLAHVRQYKPTYSSTGHYNTIKAMLKKAGYRVSIGQGFFTVSA